MNQDSLNISAHDHQPGRKPVPVKSLYGRGAWMDIASLATSLQSGDGRDLLESSSDFSMVIGALCELGRAEEAEILLRKQVESGLKLSTVDLIACRYHLTLGYLLKGRTKRARKYVAKNLSFRSKLSDDPSDLSPEAHHGLYYICQGLAFYRFYCGRFQSGLVSAKRSLLHARGSLDLNHMMTAADTSGRIHIYTGALEEGFANLDESFRLAKSLGHETQMRQVSVARVLLDARYGDQKPGQAILSLKEVMNRLPHADRFGRASIRMEIAHGIQRDRFEKHHQTLFLARKAHAFPKHPGATCAI